MPADRYNLRERKKNICCRPPTLHGITKKNKREKKKLAPISVEESQAFIRDFVPVRATLMLMCDDLERYFSTSFGEDVPVEIKEKTTAMILDTSIERRSIHERVFMLQGCLDADFGVSVFEARLTYHNGFPDIGVFFVEEARREVYKPSFIQQCLIEDIKKNPEDFWKREVYRRHLNKLD